MTPAIAVVVHMHLTFVCGLSQALATNRVCLLPCCPEVTFLLKLAWHAGLYGCHWLVPQVWQHH